METMKFFCFNFSLDNLQAMKIFNKSFLKRKREFKKVNGKMVTTNAFQVLYI